MTSWSYPSLPRARQHLPRPGDRLPTDTDFGAIFGAVRAADARFVVLDHLLPIVSPSAASCTDEDVGSA